MNRIVLSKKDNTVMKVTPLASLVLGTLFCSAVGLTGLAQERPAGIKLGHLTISPYMNLEWNYDSNVDLDTQGYKDWFLTINPGVDLTYVGNDWGINGNFWYGYDKYDKYEELDKSRYGMQFSEYWESSDKWRVVLGQSYMETDSSDSILDGGRGIWRQREYLDMNGAVSYQVSEKIGVTLDGKYSKLDYMNDNSKYGYLYGWEEWTVGAEVARRLTEKSNLLLSGSYQEYEQDNAKDAGYGSGSTGYSLMAGFGSRATERISYRVLTGTSWFDYGGEGNVGGWTYSVNANWLINKKWAATVAGSSYFQPSETELNQSMEVYTLSTGLTYRPVTRLTVVGDIGYRREEDQYSRAGYSEKMVDNIWSLRLRADYQFARHASVYAGIDYSDWESDDKNSEFDRFFGTVGVRLRY
jgi:hypothetical protein